VLADNVPVAVVAASRKGDAWKIVAALADHDDLPPRRVDTVLRLCLPEQATLLHRRADALGIAGRFLACLRNGLFLTYIGGLTLGNAVATPMERAA